MFVVENQINNIFFAKITLVFCCACVFLFSLVVVVVVVTIPSLECVWSLVKVQDRPIQAQKTRSFRNLDYNSTH